MQHTTTSQQLNSEDFILERAKEILLKRLRKPGWLVTMGEELRQFLLHNYSMLSSENFGCLFLDSNYSVISHKIIFKGTVNACATYPREIVRQALLENSTFVILVHNHPSQTMEASQSDIEATRIIKNSLFTVDIALYDHFIVAGGEVISMRQSGQLP